MGLLLIVGIPGAGKGTQSELLAPKINHEYLYSRKLIDSEKTKPGELGDYLRALPKHALVSDDKMNPLVFNFLAKNKRKDILLDGYPRNLHQAMCLDQVLNSNNIALEGVLYLVVPRGVAMLRNLRRNRQYGDDTIESIPKRLDIYEEETLPVIDFYNFTKRKVARVDGVGSIDDVAKRVDIAYRKLLYS